MPKLPFKSALFQRSMLRAGLLASTLMTAAALAPAAMAQAAAPAPAGVQGPGPVPQGKLPDAVIPSAYRLDLAVDPAKTRFGGHVEIDAQIKAPARFLYLHGNGLAVAKATVTIAGKTYVGQWQQVDPTGVALLTFDTELPAGAATFAFDYDAPFHEGPDGMFHVKVGQDWYSWTQFESIDARAAYPSFDQPGYKQPFTVTLRTPKGLVAVSNAPELSVDHQGEVDVHHFAPTAPLPTYLLAMMVGPFAVASGEAPVTPQRDHPLPMRIISTKQNADKLTFALENSKQIVAHLENYFGQSFPYPKLDQITAPIMGGAMENAGADLYQDTLLILDDHASTAQKREFGMVVSHELAHQWFGDLVTPKWWDDIWLNESFANWMGYRIGNEWRPDLNVAAGALEEGFAAMGTDALLAGRPIHQTIEQNGQIDAAFDSITYGKGGHVVAMIAAFMGDTKFRDGVRGYMAAHRYGNASSAEFFAAMAQASGDPRILPAMQSFTDQQGVPLVTFTGTNGQYTVTQSRYVRLGTQAPEQKWGVPLCVRRGDARVCQLLDTVSGTVQVGGTGALIPNAGGTGYYRFELPKAEWDGLIAQSASLTGGEGLALADSLRASFLAGRASATQLAALARVMSKNPDSYAADAATLGMQSLASADMLDAKATEAYRAFMGTIFRPQLDALGFDPHLRAYAGEAPERSQRRVQTVAQMVDTVHDAAVTATLVKAAHDWLAGDAQALDPSWYGMALRAYMASHAKGEDGGLETAKALFAKGLATQDPLARPALLGAPAGAGNAKVAGWVLSDAKDARLRATERLGMIMQVAVNRATRQQGYDWIRDNFAAMSKGGGGIFVVTRLPTVFAGMCSVKDADAIAHDFTAKMAGTPGQLELERTVERVRDCGLLKDARSKAVSMDIAKLK
jgi:aminopeptidase N